MLKPAHLALLMLIPALASYDPAAASEIDGEVGVFMFRNDDQKDQRATFLPDDKIMVRVDFDRLTRGEHKVVTSWINPVEEEQERSVHSFSLNRARGYSAWSWLALERAGLAIAGFSSFDYPEEFLGPWRVEIMLDGRLIETCQFLVYYGDALPEDSK